LPAPDFLEWLNLAVVPGVAYVVILERRLMRLEITLGMLAGRCTRDKTCQVRHISTVVEGES
jgi:hypothetical protein